LKKFNFFTSFFCIILALLDTDPDSQSGPTDHSESGYNPNPDPNTEWNTPCKFNVRTDKSV
jgi:hypothetical protein